MYSSFTEHLTCRAKLHDSWGGGGGFIDQEVAAAAANSLQSCLTLFDPIDGNPPGFTIPGILQARTLEWLPFPSPMHESEK